MVTDLMLGGKDRAKGGRWASIKRNVNRRKLAVIVLSLVLFFSTVGVWYFFVKPRNIRDLASMVENWDWTPGFDQSLAGSSVRVAGTVTGIDFNRTSLGPLTLIELDDFKEMHLVEWREADIKLGDRISKDVHFERSRFNDDIRVFSPQLDFPWLTTAQSLSVIAVAISRIQGICPLPKNDPSSDDTIVEITPEFGEGFPLSLFKASLRRGVRSSAADYEDVASGYVNNPILDSMGSLGDGTGVNRLMRFIDANSNGLFDDGDYFRLNLTRPVEDGAILTYLLTINDAFAVGPGILSGGVYVAMTDRGVFWVFGEEWGSPYRPEGRLRLRSEVDVDENVSAEVAVSDVWGPPVPLELIECELEQRGTMIDWYDLTQGNMATNDNHSASFTDADHDGVFSQGDFFAFSGLSNLSIYILHIYFINEGVIVWGWTTGIGEHTGSVPVIEWEEPAALDYPSNHSFRLRIKRMYGVPGVFLGEADAEIVVDVAMDGNGVLSFKRLTSDFNYTSSDLLITFEDADGNGYFNTGDYFIFNCSRSAQLEMAIGYVFLMGHWDCQQPLISWPVTWRTG